MKEPGPSPESLEKYDVMMLRVRHLEEALWHVAKRPHESDVADDANLSRMLARKALDPVAHEDLIVLTQFHIFRGGAEVVVKKRHEFKVWAGNLVLVDNPRSYYSPDEGDAIRGSGREV